jgi:hypothetical protein
MSGGGKSGGQMSGGQMSRGQKSGGGNVLESYTYIYIVK